MQDFSSEAAHDLAVRARQERMQKLWDDIRRKGILGLLLVTAVSAYVFREEVEQLMPLPGHVKKSRPEDRLKGIKAEARERQEALETIFK